MRRGPRGARPTSIALLLTLAAQLLAPSGLSAQTALPPVTPLDDRWGFNHVYPDSGLQDLARNAGGRWNRWEFRWDEIETAQGSFNWAGADAVVEQSRAHGLSMQGILISVPAWAREPSFLPRGLYRSWDDPENLWGRFVREMAARYRGRVPYWEAWNEPDDTQIFWPGTRADYYQLLKVTYLAAKSADPGARVLFGGLTYWHDPDFLPLVLGMMVADPTARANNFYFDGLVWHVYSRPVDILERVSWSRARLSSTVGLKPIWINETNVPAWDESAYNNRRPYQWSATAQEQASYIIQSFAHSVVSGVDKILVYRFHDVGEPQAWGLVRGDRSLRPAYVAVQVAVSYFSRATSSTLAGQGDVERVFINRPGERITVLWNKGPRAASISTTAIASSARLVDQTGVTRQVTPMAGVYDLALGVATANNGNDASDYIIGGPPLLLIESLLTPTPTPTVTPTVTPTPTRTLTPKMTPTPTPPPAVINSARSHLAARLGVAENVVALATTEARTWADTSLGCPQPGRLYAQVVTPGYRLTFAVGSGRYAYHTNDRTAIPCDSAG